MNYLFYILVGLTLIVVQTSILFRLPFGNQFFDLPVTLVIYLGMLRPPRESLPLILLMGVLMDHLSGAPFLLYTSTYVWVYFLVLALGSVLQVRLRFRLGVIVVAAVTLENAIFVLASHLTANGAYFPALQLGRFVLRLLWALLLGPVCIMLIGRLHEWWDHVVTERIKKTAGTG
jgi:rod shape-determining protein MreD